MHKKLKDGMVAVLFSPYHGAGWYSWHYVEQLLYDPQVVDMVQSNTSAKTIELYCETVYGNNHFYGGAEDLKVLWIPAGTHFRIQEYDGYETVEIRETIDWIVA